MNIVGTHGGDRRLWRRWLPRGSTTASSTIVDHFLAGAKVGRREIIDFADAATQFLAGRTALVGHGTLGIIQVIASLGRSHTAWPGANVTALDGVTRCCRIGLTTITITDPSTVHNTSHYFFASAKICRRENIDIADAAA
jgi:hypothetical protein